MSKELRDEGLENGEPAAPREREMTFWEHLEEMRGVIFRCLITFSLVMLLLAFFLGAAADILAWPLMRAQSGYPPEALVNLMSRRPFDIFTVIIQVLFLGSFFLSLPAMLFFFARFLAPGLTLKEKRLLLPGMASAYFLFLIGAAFAYLVILPITLRVALQLNQVFDFGIIWTASDYYGMVVWISVLMGALFQFPLVLILLIYIELVRTEQLKRQRRLVFVICLIIGALIVPTGDPITFLFIALPLFGLYLLSIRIGESMERRMMVRRRSEVVDEDSLT